MIITSLGNEAFEEKYKANGLLKDDVIAFGFSYWHIDPVTVDGRTVGTKLTYVGKMRPNGWVPDMLLKKMQKAQEKQFGLLFEALRQKK